MTDIPEDVLLQAREIEAADWEKYAPKMSAAYRSGEMDKGGIIPQLCIAIMAERERCAKVADNAASVGVLRSLAATYGANMAREIAATIRKGAA